MEPNASSPEPARSPLWPALAVPDKHAAARLLDLVAAETLRPALLVLSGLFLFYSVSHLLVLPPGIAEMMAALAAGTGAAFLVLYLYLGRHPLPPARTHPLAAVLAGAILLNCLAHIALMERLSDTLNLILLTIGAGFWFLSTPWLSVVLAGTWLGWGVTVAYTAHHGRPAAFDFGLFTATLLAVVLHATRVRSVLRVEGLRVQAEAQNAELEQALRTVRAAEELMEARVVERTAELARVNAALRSVTAHARCILFHSEVHLGDDGLLHWATVIPDEEAAQRVLPLDVPEGSSYRVTWVASRHPDDASRMGELAARAFAEGVRCYTQEFRCINRHGEVQWLLEEIDLAPREPGRWRVAGVCVDITDRKRLEGELRDRATELSDVNLRKDEFLATLAHELRNPLAAMLNAVEIMRVRPNRERGEHARDVVERQVHQLARLVDDLMDVARLTRGIVELRREPVEIGALISHAVLTSRPMIDARSHLFCVSVPPEPILIDADPMRVEQVLVNLLTNAAKFTEPGGRISISAEAHGDDVMIRVTDTGKGIPPGMLDRVFDVFTQVSPSIDRAEGGLGLGLTLVHRLVQMHGGTVEARSEGVGLGTEMLVRLPVFAGPAVTPRPRSSGEAAQPGELRVLVVDDNVDAAETLAELVPLWGHEVRVAHSGPGALTAAGEYRPDVLLLDIGLPGMDGYEVARRLRLDPELRNVTIVAVTGFGQNEDRERSREAGFDHHLVKPVDPDHLKQLLAQLRALPQPRSGPVEPRFAIPRAQTS